MKAETLAQQLDGSEYRFELSPEEIEYARDNKLLVVTAFSDDLAILSGFVDDEVGCYDGGNFSIDSFGLKEKWHDGEEKDKDFARAYFGRERFTTISVNILWHEDIPNWTYVVKGANHFEFDVMRVTEVFCKGVVIDCSGLE